MEKWDIIDQHRDERMYCYFFWFHGKLRRWRVGEEIREEKNVTWNTHRHENAFYNSLEKLLQNMGMYNGQTKSEFEKNFKRVNDIVQKSGGDVNKASQLARTQANRITDEWKALNRALSSKKYKYADAKEQEVFEAIFEEFFHRAYQLGSISKQQYREYKLRKLGI